MGGVLGGRLHGEKTAECSVFIKIGKYFLVVAWLDN